MQQMLKAHLLRMFLLPLPLHRDAQRAEGEGCSTEDNLKYAELHYGSLIAGVAQLLLSDQLKDEQVSQQVTNLSHAVT
jgi:hypothetical protein